MLGLEHPDTLWSMGNLAVSYFDAGRRDEALKLHEEVLALRRKVLGPDHPETLWSMGSLAISYLDAGRTEEAIQLQEKVHDIRLNVLGPENANTIQAASELSRSYFNDRQFEKGVTIRQEMLAVRKKTLGPNHPDTLRSMDTLANFQERAGQSQEALATREKLSSELEKILPPLAEIQKDQLDLLQLRAENAAHCGRWREVAADMKRAVEFDPSSWRCLSLATVLAQTEDFPAYQALCQQVLTGFAGPTIATDPERASKIWWLIPQEGADLSGPSRLAADALERGENDEVLGPWVRLSKGWGDYRIGNFREAAKLLEQVVAQGPNQARAAAAAVLAMAQHRLHQEDKAKTALAKADELLGDTFLQPEGTLQSIPDGEWRDWLMARIVFREAQASLDADTASPILTPRIP